MECVPGCHSPKAKKKLGRGTLAIPETAEYTGKCEWFDFVSIDPFDSIFLTGKTMMATCANCGQQILFGGVSRGTLRFCNQRCHDAAGHLRESWNVPDDEVEAATMAFHQGDCPCCGGPGPVDFHFSHRVMSFLVFTQFPW